MRTVVKATAARAGRMNWIPGASTRCRCASARWLVMVEVDYQVSYL